MSEVKNDKGMAQPENGQAKKKFKMPHTYAILFAIIVIVAIVTWFIPGGSYDYNEAGDAIAGTYHVVESTPQGIWDVLMAPITGMLGSDTMSGAIAISLTIMLFGSFLEMIDRTGALRIAIEAITRKSQSRTNVLICVLTTVMSFLGTLYGAYEEDIIYLMMFLPAILALGMDTMVAVMIAVLGSQVGCLASIVNPFSAGIASEIAGISPGEGLIVRFVLFVVMTAIVCVLICRYASMVRKHPERSISFHRRDADLAEFASSPTEGARLTGPQIGALIVFIMTFVIMIVGFVPWTSLDPSWTFFDDIVAAVGATPVLRNLFGIDIVPFGSWYFPELAMLAMSATLLIGIIMRYSADYTIETLIQGAAGIVSTAFVVPLARGIQVVMDDGHITPTVLNFCENTLASLPPVAFVIVALALYFLLACLIPSSTGLAAATMGIMGSLAGFAGIPVYVMIIIYCMALGMAKMVTPCSIAVMTCTAACHISYADWLKKVVPIVAILFVACCIFLCVLVMM